jgi:hypothetical protein
MPNTLFPLSFAGFEMIKRKLIFTNWKSRGENRVKEPELLRSAYIF